MNTKQIERARAMALRAGWCYFGFGTFWFGGGVILNATLIRYPVVHSTGGYFGLASIAVASITIGFCFYRHHLLMRERVHRLDRFILVVENGRPEQEIVSCLNEWTSLGGPNFLKESDGRWPKLLQGAAGRLAKGPQNKNKPTSPKR